MQTETVQGPPKGFRKAIPASVKVDVLIRQRTICSACGEPLTASDDTQFDHIPAVALRIWDEEKEDTVPPCNDASCIFAKHKDCHKAKTTGRRGESKLNAVNGDAQNISRLKRLTEKQQEFRARLLAKASGEEIEEPKGKRKWPKRSFSGGRDGPKAEGHHRRRQTSDDRRRH